MKSGYRETETQQLKKPFPKDDNDDDEGKVFRKFPRGLWGKFVASITSKWTPEARYSFCSVWKRALTTELTHTHKVPPNGRSERNPPGWDEKYLPEEESRENSGNRGMFLFVLVRASQPVVVLWGGSKEGIIVYLQDDREELCLQTYTTLWWSFCFKAYRERYRRRRQERRAVHFHFENSRRQCAGKGNSYCVKTEHVFRWRHYSSRPPKWGNAKPAMLEHSIFTNDTPTGRSVSILVN
ncbi:hypothetical protein ZHAS_00015798 [Anopheles sinensis]|uniref:Uncharacterized protein n=1 Tax=Anopheles sinensis TaxID=74873 RepID=A0A084WBY8_ANOSI|nr:hypothetical protein ZHAS_00015798 [Anopheles sinensis]